MVKARTNAQLFGCSWAGATFSSVNNSFSKIDKGRRKRTYFKIVAQKYIRKVVIYMVVSQINTYVKLLNE